MPGGFPPEYNDGIRARRGLSLQVKLWGLLIRFLCSESGQDLVEYALLGGLIALAFVGLGLFFFADAVTSLVDGMAACIDFRAGTPCGI